MPGARPIQASARRARQRERHMFNWPKRPLEQSGDLDDPEAFQLLDDWHALPSLTVVQHHETAQIAAEFIVHLVDRLQLLPDTADRIVERHIDAVVVVAGELPARIDAVARNDPSAGARFQDDKLLADRVAAA